MPFAPKTFSPNRRLFLAGLMASAALPALAKAPKSSLFPKPRVTTDTVEASTAVEDLIKQSGLTGKLSYTVADASSGEVLETRSPLLRLPPASVAKAVTAVYGLESLGGAFRFTTQVIATGPILNGRLDGDLVLVGGGDPTTTSDSLGSMAAELKAAGIREISGKFKVYSKAIPYAPWIDGDQPDHLGYNPAVSGLNLNFNRVFFEWKKKSGGYGITMDARAEKFRPHVSSVKMKIVNRTSPVFAYASKKAAEEWTVAAGALGNGGGRWLPVRKPGVYGAEVFQTIARSYGLALPKAVEAMKIPGGTVVAQAQSENLVVSTRSMLKFSNNLMAEAIGMTASIKRGKKPNSLRASAKDMNKWLSRRTEVNKASFADHSGLGDKSRISPHDMLRLLLATGWGGPLRSLMKDIGFRDAKGQAIKNHPVKVRAKTGTLNYVSSLAGYMTTKSGRKLVFVIFSADLPKRNKIPRAQRERPRGAKTWSRRSRVVQQKLIENWSASYG
jgi:D-alanyl-D-alanine carboxypeptidase/D-alanyl-D-alanine-endopeptidase (penicillin-binding protein 4)